MKKIVKAPAKINLFLKVNGKNKDNYHDLSMLMQSISLYDTIIFDIKKSSNIKDVRLRSNYPFIPTDDKNLVVKVVKYFFEKYNITGRIDIYLKKMIPTCAGLGGGSSDAASTILFLNKYYQLNLNNTELVNIASEFGSDIPFFIYGGECQCEGRGEIITKLNSFNDYYVVVATPNIRVSTKDIFNKFDDLNINEERDDDKDYKLNSLLDAIRNKDIKLLSKNLYNELSLVTEDLYKEVKIYRDRMVRYSAINSLMSGSGPSVFGIFNSFIKALKCKVKLKREFKDAFVYLSKPL